MLYYILFISSVIASSLTWAEEPPGNLKPGAPTDEVGRLMENMAIEEQYCSGVATIGYGINALKLQGQSPLGAAKSIHTELTTNFPDEDPRYLASIVTLLTLDHFKNHSVSINTLMSWHYFMCVHSIRSGNGFLLESTGVSENTEALLECEFPGKDPAACVSDIYINWVKSQ